MKPQVQPYFQRELVGPLPTPSDISEYPTQLAPIIVDSLLTRRNRSFWASELDHQRGLQEINLYLIGVLMGAKEDIIREVRDARGNYYGQVLDSSTQAHTIGAYPGTSLNDILLAMREIPETDTLDEHLTDIRAKLQMMLDGAVDPATGETTLSTLLKILLALA